MAFIKKLLSLAVISSLIAVSPGRGFHSALAQVVSQSNNPGPSVAVVTSGNSLPLPPFARLGLGANGRILSKGSLRSLSGDLLRGVRLGRGDLQPQRVARRRAQGVRARVVGVRPGLRGPGHPLLTPGASPLSRRVFALGKAPETEGLGRNRNINVGGPKTRSGRTLKGKIYAIARAAGFAFRTPDEGLIRNISPPTWKLLINAGGLNANGSRESLDPLGVSETSSSAENASAQEPSVPGLSGTSTSEDSPERPPSPSGGSTGRSFSPPHAAGQILEGAFQLGLAVGAFLSSQAYPGFSGWLQYAAWPMCGLSAALAVSGTGFLMLGARIALSRSHGTDEDLREPMKPPYTFYRKGEFNRTFLTPAEGPSPAYIPEHAGRPLKFHKSLRQRYGRIVAYSLQGAAHFRYISEEIVAAVRSVLRLGPLVREMYRGDPEVSPFVKRHGKSMYMLRGIKITQAIVGVAGSYVIGALVDAALDKDMGLGLLFAAITVGISLANLFMNTVYHWVMWRLSHTVMRDFRVHLFGHILTLPFRFFHKDKPSEVASRLSEDVNQLSAKNIDIPVVLPYYAVMASVASVMMLVTSWKLSLIIAGFIPILGMISVIYGNMTEKLTEAQMNYRAGMISAAEEGLANLRDVRGFSAEDREKERYGKHADRFLGIVLGKTRVNAVYNGSMGQFYHLSFYVAVLLAGLFSYIYLGEPSVGQTMAMVGYAGYLRGALSGFLSLYTRYRETTGSARRVLDYLAKQPAVADAPGAIDPGPLKGQVEFKNVSFSYDGQRPALKGVSFSVEPGQKVVIVGEAGAGKSAILDLILRLNDPDTGTVGIDGHDARNLRLKSLRGRVAMLHDGGMWLAGTVRENLLYGLPEGVPDEKVQEALKLVGADFVHNKILFPKGLDTYLERHNWRLTEGRKRLLEVARALLIKPGIVLLDRPTSGLDHYQEEMLRRSLGVLQNGRTTFIVDQSIETTRDADLILVLEESRIVEKGTHQELLALKGRYYRFWESEKAKRPTSQ